MPGTKIRTIFFDLDHTLWDYEVNSRETLTDLFKSHSLKSLLGCSSDDFLTTFREINDHLWHQYNYHKIDRDAIRVTRFRQIFAKYHVEDHPLSDRIAGEYLEVCPTKSHLFPHAVETLEYLSGNYPMHIITNGFNDIQQIKLKCSNLRQYFDVVVTSETAGHRKPSREIFAYACSRAKSRHHESLMVGDNLKADIEGAMAADLKAMYFNPARMPHNSSPDYEITHLRQLTELL